MILLPTIIRTNEFNYVRLWKHRPYALFQKSHVLMDDTPTFEVITIVDINDEETYPTDPSLITSFNSLEPAREHMRGLIKGEIINNILKND